MSRGTEIIETVLPTGSSEATIIVSVRYVVRPTPASTPTTRTFSRCGTSGVAVGVGDGTRLGSAGERLASGSGVNDGLRASGDDPANTASSSSRATSVAYATYAC